MTLVVIGLYLLLVITVGLLATRSFRSTGEDYFVATRSIGPFVLLMSLFGTHMTAFSLLGASGEAYRRGVGVFSLMASSSALIVPAIILLLGTRLWGIGKRNGYLTQVEFFRERWGSDAVGLLLFVMLVALLVPYLLIGVMGGGITLNQISGGEIPQWLGSLLICGVVMIYVAAGGVRSAAWVNTLQTMVFMTLGALTFFVIVHRTGGLGVALTRVDPRLLVHGDNIGAVELLSYTAIPLSVGMFPHIFMHWLTAKRASAFRLSIVAYPVCIAIVWLPSVLLGVLGTADVPGLVGPAANSVLVRMIGLHAPGVLAGLLAAGVFAAVMSSLDSQTLSLSTLFTRDIVRRYVYKSEMSEKTEVLVGRLFVGGILAVAWLLSLVIERSIFRLGIWSFTGFAALLPLVVAAVYWRRSTRVGALATILTVVVSWVYFVERSWSDPGYSVGGTGLKPVVVMLFLSSLAMALGSLVSRPPGDEVVARFFDDAETHRR